MKRAMMNVLAIGLCVAMLVGTALPATAVDALTLTWRGDVNGDGAINTTDARLILQYAAGVDNAVLNLSAADADMEYGVTTTDARLVLQFAAGLIEGFRTPEAPMATQKLTAMPTGETVTVTPLEASTVTGRWQEGYNTCVFLVRTAEEWAKLQAFYGVAQECDRGGMMRHGLADVNAAVFEEHAVLVVREIDSVDFLATATVPTVTKTGSILNVHTQITALRNYGSVGFYWRFIPVQIPKTELEGVTDVAVYVEDVIGYEV